MKKRPFNGGELVAKLYEFGLTATISPHWQGVA